MKKIYLVSILLAFVCVSQLPDRKLHIIFCDVGQGDSALILLGKFQALIDAGPANTKAVACLGRHMPFWDKEIELFIASHDQADHVGGLVEIEKRYRIGRKMGSELISGDILRYSNLDFDILWPTRKVDGSGSNEVGVVIKLVFEGFRALFTADIGETEELALVSMGVLEKMDLLKVAHHGSKFSSSQNFLNTVVPKLAVVSVGKNNSYGHPSAEILNRFVTLRSSILRTDLSGDVEIVSDGRGYRVKTDR